MFFNDRAGYGQSVIPLDMPIVIYGTQWCGMTQMIRRYLDRSGIPYRYIDIETNPRARAQLQWLTGGYTSHPTIYINGQLLIEPTLNELKQAVEEISWNG